MFRDPFLTRETLMDRNLVGLEDGGHENWDFDLHSPRTAPAAPSSKRP